MAGSNRAKDFKYRTEGSGDSKKVVITNKPKVPTGKPIPARKVGKAALVAVAVSAVKNQYDKYQAKKELDKKTKKKK